MLTLKSKDILTGDELSSQEVQQTLDLASQLKARRNEGFGRELLQGKTLALLFDKPSLRTRLSFYVAMQELGGHIVESIGSTRKQEEPQDLARVISGYCHAIMVRTFDDLYIQRMAEASSIPVINGLSDRFHPCQTLADLLTIKEHFGRLSGIKIAYIGDGNNILHSFFPMVEKTGIELSYACPEDYGPEASVVARYKNSGLISGYNDPYQAVKNADVIYTDVWTSMGFEAESQQREEAFQNFQVNRKLMESSGRSPKVMHCLPMVRGKEIADEIPDSSDSLIFKQCENRLHVQKALLVGLLNREIKEIADGKAQERVCS